ncbi:MAG: SMC family ATPase [Prolixibacteraceae bacterium]|jgi:exonuclease SbcC|nr:SMC family ATPase [Prolixibacteraceae bacterium]
MIPVSLIIQGLYSYQEKQIIDFTKLTAAHLFGIFGTVGSGKSSVLEAITFSIYGKTDRLNLSGDNRNYNMMNLKSDEMLIDFIFETGKEQTPYRAIVKGKRNSKRFEDVKKLDRTAYRQTNNEWMPVELAELEAAIGLSYENFKRTIIIPQGQFQEFLQLGNKDRTQMMKELFNLEKFEFYYKVTTLESANNEKLQNIEGQLQQLGAVDSGQLKEYETRQAELRKELAIQNEKLTGQRAYEQKWQRLKELHLKFKNAQNELQEFEKLVPKYTELEKKITRYEQCLIGFKHMIDTKNATEQRAKSRRKQINIDSEKLIAVKAKIEVLEKSLSEIKPAYEKREELKKKADELLRAIKINELNQLIKTESERLANGKEAIKQKDEEIQQAKEEKVNFEKELKTLKLSLPDMNELANAKSWHVEKQNIEKQIKASNTEFERVQSEINKVNDKLKNLLSSITVLSENATADETITFLRKKTEAGSVRQTELELSISNLRVKEQLQKYAESLHDGEPCPLCGSVQHPEKYSIGGIKAELEKLNSQKAKEESTIEQTRELIEKIKELGSQSKFIKQQIELVSNSLKEQKLLLKKHNEKYQWPKYDSEQQVKKAFECANEAQAKITIAETSLEKLANEIDKMLTDKERYMAGIEKIHSMVIERTSEVKTLTGQLGIISINEYQQKTKQNIENENVMLIEEYNKLGELYDDIGNQLTAYRKTQDTLSGSLETSKKELMLDEESITSLNRQLDEQLGKSEFGNLVEVKEILAQSINLELEKTNITNFKEKLSAWKNQAKNLEDEISGQEYKVEEHEKIKAGVLILTEQVTQKNQELGRVEELLKKLKIDIEKQKDLRKQFEALGLRGENIKTLKSLFKASGFVNYISSVYLQNLCNAANDRFFKLTRQKLSLEITDDNNFIVRDFMNGGKTRSVKTLSGGQTFQAALSLALALADNIQKITESNQNFFFLDEGFGSLDKESLGVVFDTLKTLRRENRIVGVISHVEEMQQEIDIHLRIENDEKEGSLVRRSWAE